MALLQINIHPNATFDLFKEIKFNSRFIRNSWSFATTKKNSIMVPWMNSPKNIELRDLPYRRNFRTLLYVDSIYRFNMRVLYFEHFMVLNNASLRHQRSKGKHFANIFRTEKFKIVLFYLQKNLKSKKRQLQ